MSNNQYKLKVGEKCLVYIKGDSKEVWAEATPKFIGTKVIVFESDKGKEYSRSKSTIKTKPFKSKKEVICENLRQEAENIIRDEFKRSESHADYTAVIQVLVEKLYYDKLDRLGAFDGVGKSNLSLVDTTVKPELHKGSYPHINTWKLVENDFIGVLRDRGVK